MRRRRHHDGLIDSVSWAVAQGYADQDRIAAIGGSYGGYAALVGVAFTPDAFAPPVDHVGISSLVNFLRTVPPYSKPQLANNWHLFANDVRGRPDGVRQPRRSPARGAEVGYLVFDDEGHMFVNPEKVIAMFRTAARFLAQHLGARQ